MYSQVIRPSCQEIFLVCITTCFPFKLSELNSIQSNFIYTAAVTINTVSAWPPKQASGDGRCICPLHWTRTFTSFQRELFFLMKSIYFSNKRDAGVPWCVGSDEGWDQGRGVQRPGQHEWTKAATVPRKPAHQWADPRVPGVQQVQVHRVSADRRWVKYGIPRILFQMSKKT